jgi:hypothetical protein
MRRRLPLPNASAAPARTSTCSWQSPAAASSAASSVRTAIVSRCTPPRTITGVRVATNRSKNSCASIGRRSSGTLRSLRTPV